MDLTKFETLLAFGAPPAQPGQTQPSPLLQFVPLILLVVIFYFALIRPQQRRARMHAEMLKTIRPGDKIVTSGGVVGVIITVKEKTLTLRSADAKFEITKSAVTEITERSGESSES
jgi:preprotein translocase subunit YajC